MAERKYVNGVFRDRLFRKVKEKGIKQCDMAKQAGIDRTTVYKYEKGEIKALSTKKVEEIAKKLDVSPAYLMGWDFDVDTDINDSKDILASLIGLVSEIDRINSQIDKKIPEGNAKANQKVSFETLKTYITEETKNCRRLGKSRKPINKGVWELYNLLLNYSMEDVRKIMKKTMENFSEGHKRKNNQK